MNQMNKTDLDVVAVTCSDIFKRTSFLQINLTNNSELKNYSNKLEKVDPIYDLRSAQLLTGSPIRFG